MSGAHPPGPVHWLVPGPLDQVTGGYRYDRRIVEGMRGAGVPVAVHELPGAYPLADSQTIRSAESVLAAIPAGAVVVIDGLALPGVARSLPGEGRRLRLVGLVHHPLCLETGLGAEEAASLKRLERDSLAHMHRVIVTSPYTAGVLREFGVGGDGIGVVVPGTERAGAPGRASGHGRPPEMLCVATLTARKGHLVLVEALGRIKDLDWHLTCIGSLSRDTELVARVRAAITAHGLDGRVALAGEREPGTMAGAYAQADLFVLPSFYEGYGMAFAEALAHGLPVIGTTAGAIPTTVPEGAGLLVPPGDATALARTLRGVLTDANLRRNLTAGARAAAGGLPGWEDQVARFIDELRRAG